MSLETGEDGLPESEDLGYDEPPNQGEDVDLPKSENKEPLKKPAQGSLPPIKQTDLILIAGKRGSGKTNLLLYLIKTLTALKVNMIIVDPVYDLKANLLELNKVEDKRVIHIKYGNRNAFSTFMYKLFKARWKGVIVVDEADNFFPNRKILSDMENYFIQIGRHHGIGGIFVTRRLARMHTDIASQANKLMLFKHWQRSDLDYLRESNLGDYADYLRGLQKYCFLFIDTDQEFLRICNPVPKLK